MVARSAIQKLQDIPPALTAQSSPTRNNPVTNYVVDQAMARKAARPFDAKRDKTHHKKNTASQVGQSGHMRCIFGRASSDLPSKHQSLLLSKKITGDHSCAQLLKEKLAFLGDGVH